MLRFGYSAIFNMEVVFLSEDAVCSEVHTPPFGLCILPREMSTDAEGLVSGITFWQNEVLDEC